MMTRAGFHAAAAIAAVSLAVAAACAQGEAKDTLYPRMAPLAQYLTPQSRAEIALARSAAPSSISLHATVLVLTSSGYRVVQTGSNGFTCLVERSWMNPFDRLRVLGLEDARAGLLQP